MGNSTVIELKILNKLWVERVNKNNGSKHKRKTGIISRLQGLIQALESYTSEKSMPTFSQMYDRGVKI
ncbi:MAG: hypothetical protein N2508_05005 [Anaerolineae bacterium]|nr:hypothetical protein [Anaerolineae bacterium]